jgi:hypothetical protein
MTKLIVAFRNCANAPKNKYDIKRNALLALLASVLLLKVDSRCTININSIVFLCAVSSFCLIQSGVRFQNVNGYIYIHIYIYIYKEALLCTLYG